MNSIVFTTTTVPTTAPGSSCGTLGLWLGSIRWNWLDGPVDGGELQGIEMPIDGLEVPAPKEPPEGGQGRRMRRGEHKVLGGRDQLALGLSRLTPQQECCLPGTP